MPGKCEWPMCKSNAVGDSIYCIPHGSIYDEKPKAEKAKNPIPTMSAKKKAAMPKEKAKKLELKSFYDHALELAPHNCEECGELLFESTIINPRTIVAHILPKSDKHGFPSVATNQTNVMYLCAKDHNWFDFKGKDYVLNMKLLPEIKRRVKELLPLLTADELSRVPEYLL